MFAFGMGLLHALDADHILAVSVLSSNKASFKKSMRYALRWSLGHGLILVSIMMLIYYLGFDLPAEVTAVAEQVVGLVLIVLGLVLLYQIRKQNLHLHFHKHEGKQEHAHWHKHEDKDTKKQNHRHEHKAFFIGGLHGLAGSAPLLAVIPVAKADQLLLSFLYISVFSLGVFLAMVCFGGAFGSSLKKLMSMSEKYAMVAKALIAIMSIGVGLHFVSG